MHTPQRVPPFCGEGVARGNLRVVLTEDQGHMGESLMKLVSVRIFFSAGCPELTRNLNQLFSAWQRRQ